MLELQARDVVQKRYTLTAQKAWNNEKGGMGRKSMLVDHHVLLVLHHLVSDFIVILVRVIGPRFGRRWGRGVRVSILRRTIRITNRGVF